MFNTVDLRVHINTKYITKQVRINPEYPYKSQEIYLVEEKKKENDLVLKLDFEMFILETFKFLLKEENDKLIKPYQIDYCKINTQLVYDKIHSLLKLTEYSKILQIFENNQVIFEKTNFEKSIVNVFMKKYNKNFNNMNDCINYMKLNNK